MKIDPDRTITITLPFHMIDKLSSVKPILGMFRDEPGVKAAMDIIDAIYSGAVEFVREEDGEINRIIMDGSEAGELDEFFDDEVGEDEEKN